MGVHFTYIVQRKIRKQNRLLVNAFFVSVLLLLCVYVAHAQTVASDLTVKKLFVFPGKITSTSWKNTNALYSQDYGNNALYQEFTQQGSAYLDVPDLIKSNPPAFI